MCAFSKSHCIFLCMDRRQITVVNYINKEGNIFSFTTAYKEDWGHGECCRAGQYWHIMVAEAGSTGPWGVGRRNREDSLNKEEIA